MHYKDKNYIEAYKIYAYVANGHKNTNEAKYALQQMDNIKKKCNLDLSFEEDDYKDFIKEIINKEKELQKKIKKKDVLLVTSCNIEGYEIIEYKKILTSQSIIGTGFLSEFKASFSDITGTSSKAFEKKIEDVKESALSKLKTKAILEDCNAVINVKIDLEIFGSNLICIMTTGTGVRINKK